MARKYAHPDVLVSTDWVDEHRSDSDNIRIIESNEDVLLYSTGHVPEAVHIDWFNDLQHPIIRDYVDERMFEELCESKGINNDTFVVFYGDKSNWWACYAFWAFKLFGHEKCAVMNGGRQKWLAENRATSTEAPHYPRGNYTAKPQDMDIRALRGDVAQHLQTSGPMIDVRSPGEFSGELTHMPDYPQEGALRGGHIPGAHSVPWSRAVNEDGTFKSADELADIYQEECGINEGDDVVVYCRIGERSSHTWFVLKYLLGYEKVRNYDGSWTEWGNLVGVPIEKTSGSREAVQV